MVGSSLSPFAFIAVGLSITAGCIGNRVIEINNIGGPKPSARTYPWIRCSGEAKQACISAFERVEGRDLPAATAILRGAHHHTPIKVYSQQAYSAADLYADQVITSIGLQKYPEALLYQLRADAMNHNRDRGGSEVSDITRLATVDIDKGWSWLEAREAAASAGHRSMPPERAEAVKKMVACKPTERWTKEKGCEAGLAHAAVSCRFGLDAECVELCAAGNGASCFRAQAEGQTMMPLMKRGCELGSPEACAWLAIAYWKFEPVEQSPDPKVRALELDQGERYRAMACSGGVAVACDMEGQRPIVP